LSEKLTYADKKKRNRGKPRNEDWTIYRKGIRYAGSVNGGIARRISPRGEKREDKFRYFRKRRQTGALENRMAAQKGTRPFEKTLQKEEIVRSSP